MKFGVFKEYGVLSKPAFYKKTRQKGFYKNVTRLAGWLAKLVKRLKSSITPSPKRRHPSTIPPTQAPAKPSDEEERLKALNEYNILDTPAEEAFDDLTRLAASICGTPIALVSLTATNRQWFKSKVGIDSPEVPREDAFCAHAILNPDQVMIVPDASEDDRFAGNPLVTSAPDIRFYAGNPLITPDGFPIGTLCVLDRIPRNLTPEQLDALQVLGRQVIAQMELRLNVSRLERQLARYQQVKAKLRASDQQVVDLLESMTDAFFALDPQWRFTYVNQKAAEILQRNIDELLGQDIWEALPEMVGSVFDEQYRKAVAQQISLSFEDFHWPTTKWFEIRVFPSYEGLSVFFHDISRRKVVEEALRYQQGQSERLLLNILPEPIAERLKQEENIIADSFDEVSVLFADLVNFTQMASRISPTELVALLNEIFSIFDCLTEKHGLEKIKTIGDAYMVAGGVPLPKSNHAEAIAEMALDMQSSLEDFNAKRGTDFALRIGINTGTVVAGVIGTKKFIYDLWGDTVNTASRMESHGAAGCIQITETTYHHIQDQYLFEDRGVISVKGKGEMQTYFIKGRRINL
ncbi:MAG: PAS domain-containing protein [Microcoleus vaginatus WJT46-NPBG5]|jgi:PAS domain S-box-containing protein|nr:PAS domain-containing protein [Microcoleus vaginatus WJT46-NPBG5]